MTGYIKKSPADREGSTGDDEGIRSKSSVDGAVTVAEAYLTGALSLKSIARTADGGGKPVEDAAAG